MQTSAALPTAAPTISVSGSTVTLAPGDEIHNGTIFYTTDGTGPAIFGPGASAGTTKIYSQPFTVAGGTVKAVASWGQGANQGIKFPSFGYVPSQIVTATVAGTGVPPPAGSGATLSSAYLEAKGGANTLAAGRTLQFTAYGLYADGSVAALPSPRGERVTSWNTSNHTVAKVSSTGHVTAMGPGKVNIQAMVGTMPSHVWTLTVGAPAGATAATPGTERARAEPAPVGDSLETPAEVASAPAAADGGGAPSSPVP